MAISDTFVQAPGEPADKRPLVVDLDGTLVKSDLLHEALFTRVGRDPASVFGLAGGHLRREMNRRVVVETIELRPNNVLTKQANIRSCPRD